MLDRFDDTSDVDRLKMVVIIKQLQLQREDVTGVCLNRLQLRTWKQGGAESKTWCKIKSCMGKHYSTQGSWAITQPSTS